VDPRNDCPVPVQVPYGVPRVQYLVSGTIVEYSCFENHILVGNAVVHCNLVDHMWLIEEIPKCGEYRIVQISYRNKQNTFVYE